MAHKGPQDRYTYTVRALHQDDDVEEEEEKEEVMSALATAIHVHFYECRNIYIYI